MRASTKLAKSLNPGHKEIRDHFNRFLRAVKQQSSLFHAKYKSEKYANGFPLLVIEVSKFLTCNGLEEVTLPTGCSSSPPRSVMLFNANGRFDETQL